MEKTKSKGNFKENFKKHWKIALVSLVLVVLLAGAGLLLLFSGNRDSQEEVAATYTVQVKNASGTAMEEVFLVLCSEDGTELNWLPYVTNMNGKVQFDGDVEEGCYVKVVGVPMGYKTEENVKYTFDANGTVTIVLAEDDAAYAAQIGETKYFSLATALGMTNGAGAGEEITVDLLADATLKSYKFGNIYGAKITINGNGHTITLAEDTNALIVNQKGGELAFKNINFVHKNSGSLVQMTGLTTVSLTDVNVDATKGTAYNYCLFNTLATDGTMTLNMTRVNVNMAVGSAGKDAYGGIIRTGNAGGKKNVNINLDSCKFDTTGATGRHGIIVMKDTVATINIKNSQIKAGDAYAVYAVEQTKAQTLTSVNSKYISTSYPTAPVKGYSVQIGNTWYLPLQAAADVANASTSDVTLKFVCDFTMNTATIHNKNGKLVTIDGAGSTVTTSGGANAFVVGGNIAFKNMTINHKNISSAIQIKELANVEMTDVNLKATEGKTYEYCLINMLATGNTTTLNCTRVNATMAVESAGKDANAAIIRTGNSSYKDANGNLVSGVKTVEINLTDCNFDTTKATGRSAIVVMADTTATVNIKNSTLATMDDYVIRSNKQDINWNVADTTLDSLSETYKEYPVEWYLAKIDDVYYTLEEATKVANAATTDTSIQILTNHTLGTININNKNGKMVTVDGNGKTITTSGTANAFVLGHNVTFKNMTVTHKNSGSVFHITEAGTVNVEKVTVNATSGSKYDYTLVNILATDDVTTLNMNGVNMTMSVAGAGADGKESQKAALIRTGNETYNDKNGKPVSGVKTVNINLTNCKLDATKATGRSGIVIMKQTTANIVLDGTTITTLDEAPIRARESSSLAYTLKMTNSTLDSKTIEYNKSNKPIRGYDAKIGDVYYHDLKNALAVANAGDTVELLQDITVNNQDITKAVTIDGKNHTITTTGSYYGFKVNAAVAVELKNMKFAFQSTGVAVRTDVAGADLRLTNVDINSTANVDYTLINLLGAGTATTKLTLTNVNVDMNASKAGKDAYVAIIRTGNNPYGSGAGYVSGEKNVEITITNSKLDASDAVGRSVISVMKTSDATINVQNSTLKTKNVSAIINNNTSAGQATVDGNDFVCGKKVDDVKGYAAKKGNVYYGSLGKAIEQANDGDTIEILQDITVNNQNITKAITIDGNNHTITTTDPESKGNYGFKVNAAVAVELKDMKLAFQSTGVAVRTDVAGADLRLTNVDIKSTANVGHTLINTLGAGTATTKLTLTNVNVDMDTTGAGKDAYAAIIRTGNNPYGSGAGYVSGEKNVEITIVDSKLDATDAVGRSAICVMTTSNATIKVENSTLKTKNVSAIINNNTSAGQATIIDTEFVSETEVDDLKGYMLQVNDTWYVAETLYNVLNNATEDVTIKLTADLSLNLDKINNKNGKKITIVPNGFNFEYTGSSSSVIISSDTEVIVNGQTRYLSVEEGIAAANSANDDVTLKFNIDYQLDLTNLNNANGKMITVVPNGNVITGTGTLQNTVTVSGCKATCKVGNVTYFNADFTEAVAKAHAVTGDAIITLYDDVTVSNVELRKAITIEGNNHTITTTTANGFRFYSADVFTLNNIKYAFNSVDVAIRIETAGADVRLNNVEFTVGGHVLWALFNFNAEGNALSKLTLTGVNVSYQNIPSLSVNNRAIIRTGNGKNNVSITIKDSTLDASGAPNRHGIAILGTTQATVDIANTTIKTNNVAPIMDNSGVASIRKTNYTVDVTSSDWDNTVAHIGNTKYESLNAAIDAANKATGNTRIELLANATVSAKDLSKNIIIDGNNYTIKTEGGNHAFSVKATSVGFCNVTIEHHNWGAAIQTSTVGATLNMTDVYLDARHADNSESNYRWALIALNVNSTLNMTRVDVDMEVTTAGNGGGDENGIIRTGNNESSKTKEVTINMSDCRLDASKATGRSGIMILDAVATINLSNGTTIKTQSQTYCAAIQGCTDTSYSAATLKANITIDDTCSLQSGDVVYTPGNSTDPGATIQNLSADSTVEVIPTNAQTPATMSLNKAPEETKQLILNVPVRIYNALVDLIKKFAEANGWDLDL